MVGGLLLGYAIDLVIRVRGTDLIHRRHSDLNVRGRSMTTPTNLLHLDDRRVNGANLDRLPLTFSSIDANDRTGSLARRRRGIRAGAGRILGLETVNNGSRFQLI